MLAQNGRFDREELIRLELISQETNTFTAVYHIQEDFTSINFESWLTADLEAILIKFTGGKNVCLRALSKFEKAYSHCLATRV